MLKFTIPLLILLLSINNFTYSATKFCPWQINKKNKTVLKRNDPIQKFDTCNLEDLSNKNLKKIKNGKIFFRNYDTSNNKEYTKASIAYMDAPIDDVKYVFETPSVFETLISAVSNSKHVEIYNTSQLQELLPENKLKTPELYIKKGIFSSSRLKFNAFIYSVDENIYKNTYTFTDGNAYNVINTYVWSKNYYEDYYAIWKFIPYEGGTIIAAFSKDIFKISTNRYLTKWIIKSSTINFYKDLRKLLKNLP